MRTQAQRLVQVAFLVILLAWAMPTAAAEKSPCNLPRPLPHHPGNIFLQGETVTVKLPMRGSWQLLDAEDKVIKSFDLEHAEELEVGVLPVGFYRLRNERYPDWVSLAVISPLRAPVPETSPIAVDVAMSWFYREQRMRDVANLCALAGVNWVRDRLSWGELEPRRGEFVWQTRYDVAAEMQSAAGLKVLQVFHASPKWANPETKRFPLDLRDCYRFLKEIARRWKNKVLAIEPWNEADIPVFGGHVGSEMASLQKAAYWAVKSVSPDTLVCWNVFATNNRAHLEDIASNDILPYCDTFNFHHYRSLEELPSLYTSFRQVACGRPLWITECALPLRWTGDPERQELSDQDLFEQAKRLIKVFSSSLHEGASVVFYFLLPHYVEGPTQFGILRRDLTPRPAYVSLAATGRLLADARPRGKLAHESVQGYLFEAKPDGQPSLVLVVWSRENEVLPLPYKPEAIFDYLGRAVPEETAALRVTDAPTFVLLPLAALGELKVVEPPLPESAATGQPCPVVFQTIWPSARVDLSHSAYRVHPGENGVEFPLYVYNFGEEEIEGDFTVIKPSGWVIELAEKCRVLPGERLGLSLRLRPPETEWTGPAVVRVEGEFGRHGRSVLSFRVVPERSGTQ